MNLRLKKLRKVIIEIYIYSNETKIETVTKIKKKKKYEIETYQFNRLNTIANKMVKKKKFQKI